VSSSSFLLVRFPLLQPTEFISSSCSCRHALLVLAAPRVDYLAESLARKAAREQQIAAANARDRAREQAATAPSLVPSSIGTLSPNSYHPSPSTDSPLFDSYSQLPDAFVDAGGAAGFDFSNFAIDPSFGSVFPDFFTFGNDPCMVGRLLYYPFRLRARQTLLVFSLSRVDSLPYATRTSTDSAPPDQLFSL
jgi:hypothetical protein